MSKILVVGINGSPHKTGVTASFLEEFLASVKKHGGETKLVHLIDHKINSCLGCWSVNPKACKYPCVQKDVMQKIYPLLIKADAIIFGTPVYWLNMSGLMKNFIDRLTCLYGGRLLEGKVGVAFSASKENEGGRINAGLAIAGALNQFGFLIPGNGIMFYPGEEKVVKNGKVVWDNWLKKDSPRIAGNIIRLCKFLRKAKFEWSGTKID